MKFEPPAFDSERETRAVSARVYLSMYKNGPLSFLM